MMHDQTHPFLSFYMCPKPEKYKPRIMTAPTPASATDNAAFTPKLFTLLRAGYGRDLLRSDLLAGLTTVAIVALPLAMAIAIASGASPEKGLITAVIAGFLISFLGGSRVQIGGPTGAFIVVVFNVIAQHGYDGLLLATLMAGVILIVAGYARFGQVIKYIPLPVVTGFTAGIAVIIATSQVKDFLGLQMDEVPAEFIPKWGAYLGHIGSMEWVTLAVGVLALAAILLLKRFVPKAPGYLIAVILSAALVYALHLDTATIGSRFGDLPGGLPLPSWPQWSWQKIAEVTPAAFTIAFLAGIEALLSAVVADGMTGYKHRPNQELVAQGVANLGSVFFGGLPATGAIARTATNIKSGGKTPMAGIFHALFILVFMLFLSKAILFVPLAALSAILFIVAWNMSEIHHFIRIYKFSRSDRLVLLLTFGLTVLVDLTVAIGVGVTLAALLFMVQMSEADSFHAQSGHIEDLEPHEYGEEINQRDNLPAGVEVFRITGPVFFGMAGTMLETLKQMGKMPRILIIRMKLVPFIDAAGVMALQNTVKFCESAGTIVIFSGLQAQPEKILAKSGMEAGGDNIKITKTYRDAIKLASEL